MENHENAPPQLAEGEDPVAALENIIKQSDPLLAPFGLIAAYALAKSARAHRDRARAQVGKIILASLGTVLLCGALIWLSLVLAEGAFGKMIAVALFGGVATFFIFWLLTGIAKAENNALVWVVGLGLMVAFGLASYFSAGVIRELLLELSAGAALALSVDRLLNHFLVSSRKALDDAIKAGGKNASASVRLLRVIHAAITEQRPAQAASPGAAK